MIYPTADLVAQSAQPDEYGIYPEDQQSQAYYPVKIGAVVEQVPWFISNNLVGFVFSFQRKIRISSHCLLGICQ